MSNDKPQQPPKNFWVRAFARYNAWHARHELLSSIITLTLLLAIVGCSVAISFRVPTDGSITDRWWILPLVFFASMVGSASVFLPAPALAVACIALTRTTLPSVDAGLIVVFGAAGSTLGELTAYALGYTGSGYFKRSRYYERIHTLVTKHGGPIILVITFFPLPLFDLAGIAAGSIRMSLPKFLIWVFGGKLLKLILLAILCVVLFDWAIQPEQAWAWRIWGLNQPQS